MSTFLFLNRNTEKTSYDRMTVRKEDMQVHVNYIDYYSDDKKGIHTTYSIMDFYQYINNILDFLQTDKDDTPFTTMDVMIPGYPVVAMDFRDNFVRDLILRTLYCWILSA
jgi:hypothetical protein